MNDTSINDLLERGKAALKAGRQEDARTLFEKVLAKEERNEQAWLWLSGAVDSDADRRICLENVLEINPHNGRARKALNLLRQREGQGGVSPFVSVRSLKSKLDPTLSSLETEAMAEEAPEISPAPEPSLEAQEAQEEEVIDEPPEETDKQALKWVIGCGVFLALLAIVVLGAWYLMCGDWASPAPTLAARPTTAPTRSQPGDAPPTWTPSPSATPPDTATPRPSRTMRSTPTPLLTWTPTITPTATLTGTSTLTPTATLTPPPTWTPPPPDVTRPPTWTPRPSNTPVPGMTLPPTWTPQPTNSPVPAMTMPPTWTPLPTSTMFPAPTPSPTSTLTVTMTTDQ